MPKEYNYQPELEQTHDVTEASNKFLWRNKFWKTAEKAYDFGRAVTLPARLAGNIIKNVAKVWDGDSFEESTGNIIWTLTTIVGTGLIIGGALSNPLGWLAIGIGAFLDIPGVMLTTEGTINGVVETSEKAKERSEYIKAKRAERRARWK